MVYSVYSKGYPSFCIAVNNEVAIQKALESELDCFCVADEKGHKVCTPENCDSGKHTLLIQFKGWNLEMYYTNSSRHKLY